MGKREGGVVIENRKGNKKKGIKIEKYVLGKFYGSVVAYI